MEKIYRVQMNSKGMPNFSTAKEITYCYNCKWHITNLTEFSSDEDYLRCPMMVLEWNDDFGKVILREQVNSEPYEVIDIVDLLEAWRFYKASKTEPPIELQEAYFKGYQEGKEHERRQLEARFDERFGKTEPQRNMAEDIVESFGFVVESYRQAKAKDEPQTEECPFDDAIPCEWVCTEWNHCKYKPTDEPQTETHEIRTETHECVNPDCGWK